MNVFEALKPARRVFLIAAAFLAAATLSHPLLAAEGGAKSLRIGIIGAGNVGGTVGTLWAKAGHEVMFSSLDIEADRKLAASVGKNARAGTPKEAAAFGEVLFFAVPYTALPGLGKELAAEIKGKVVIDASNP